MGRLVYAAITSLDGYVADADGQFEWAAPDAEVHAFVNDVERTIGTLLLGRRTYDVLLAWETMETGPDVEPVIRDFAAIWRDTDKVIHSRTRESVASARTTLVRDFDPEAVRRLKATADRDLGIGGPELAAHAFAAGLVDEVHLFLNPVLVGGGSRALPAGVRLDLELLDHRRFGNGVVHLHHRVVG